VLIIFLILVLVVGCSIYLGIVILNLLASGLLILGTIKVRLMSIISFDDYLISFCDEILFIVFISFYPFQERHLMLVPWLINSGVSLVFSIIFNFAGVIGSLSSGMPLEYIPSVMIAILALGK